jgi:tRNA dimethylallyltransferase
MRQIPIICLMGPTASGKTALALEIVKRFPCDIISVDSAMVYRGMNIGTAKPDQTLLKIAPHRLIDIRDPADSYSAGQFYQDAWREIQAIDASGRIPLLVGGTMLYFRLLQQGIADLPKADKDCRADLTARAAKVGWPALHAELMKFDSDTAKRLNPQDSQRIQRAYEVYALTGKTLSSFLNEQNNNLPPHQFYSLALIPSDRSGLHQLIAARFQHMLAQGFIEEVRQLYKRPDLNPQLPAIRSVGYREIWSYLAGEINYLEMQEKALAATRQLAKRQLTWLRSWPHVLAFSASHNIVVDEVLLQLESIINGLR